MPGSVTSKSLMNTGPKRKWPDYFAPWLPQVENVQEEALCDTVGRVPAGTMVQAQREFAKALLRVTLRRVKDILL